MKLTDKEYESFKRILEYCKALNKKLIMQKKQNEKTKRNRRKTR